MKIFSPSTVHYTSLYLVGLLIMLSSCKKIKDLTKDPDIGPLKHGFQTSAAIGYCATMAASLFKGEELPPNVLISSKSEGEFEQSAIMVITINKSYPLPFNSSVGQITMAGLWNEDGGVITAVFTDINIIEAKYELKGIRTIPIMTMENGQLLTLIAEEDIVVGQGSDTLLHLNMGNTNISLEMERLESPQPDDAFVAVAQNVWFITIDQNNTLSDVYDDTYTINGGGQIAEIADESGGILYHAIIGARYNTSNCLLNPTEGVGFIQNLKAGSTLDLGHIFLDFRSSCDGKAYVEFATGKYLTYNHRKVKLNFY